MFEVHSWSSPPYLPVSLTHVLPIPNELWPHLTQQKHQDGRQQSLVLQPFSSQLAEKETGDAYRLILPGVEKSAVDMMDHEKRGQKTDIEESWRRTIILGFIDCEVLKKALVGRLSVITKTYHDCILTKKQGHFDNRWYTNKPCA